MKKYLSIIIVLFIIFITPMMFSGCSSTKINFYNTETKTIESLDLEDYIAGVVAGEMYNNWPVESLKAQCILARTFTMDFIKNKNSKYEGADISNDITEAQAYNSQNINDKIKQAVNETKGLVIKSNNDYINAWFHSNSGGITELSSIGLNYTEKDPLYIKSVKSPEDSNNSQNFNWEYTFNKADILRALSNMGITVNTISGFKIGEKSNSGRVINFSVDNKEINANTFRLAVGNTKLKSTLIKSITETTDTITFKGLGYGHGVGLSQWGAKILAEQGKDYNYILNYYFDNIEIVKN